jgi:hypothetical protein
MAAPNPVNFYSPIDLQENELRKHVVEKIAGNASTPAEARFWYDTVAKKIKYYNGTSVVTVGDQTPGAMTYRGTIPITATEPVAPATGDVYIFSGAGVTTNFGAQDVQAGDFVVYNGATWDVIQGNVVIASTTAAGIVELATDAETQAGTDATRAVTPEGLANDYLAKGITASQSIAQNLTANTDVTYTFTNLASVMSFIVLNSTGDQIFLDARKTGANTVRLNSNVALTGVEVLATGTLG